MVTPSRSLWVEPCNNTAYVVEMVDYLADSSIILTSYPPNMPDEQKTVVRRDILRKDLPYEIEKYFFNYFIVRLKGII